ncbi:carbohydrate kinase family protein [Chitinophaga qingshengii]|uniref:Carbohydrate kinase n=1 Tax=Chitinophaga qingshengii TaxID=1569794 RepID=A0ABR7TS60_9BACT|nr:carbohydrate kinase [Chitinophaga qingshengii]MBC9932234.1 carbohydrate kinase [Chitinophaga qingshengii]
MKPVTVCFGEMLWDIFPNGVRKPGGAPFNVAYHLSRLGMDSHIISRTGTDEAGDELRNILHAWQIPQALIQHDPQQPTGAVLATADANHEMHYDILQPVAWDFIAWQPEQETLVRNAGAFVFGSLAIRNSVSRDTLWKLLGAARFKVFDINIRPPHSDMDTIRELLNRVDLVKMNEEELQLVLAASGETYTTPLEGARAVMLRYGVPQLIITRGSKGAVYVNRHEHYERPAKQVVVKDTVGSGDSFLAGFLSQLLKGRSVSAALDLAVEVSGFVTTREGACPEYDAAQFGVV